MKKTLVSALTTALVVGAASTTFAAANPFADVPADHWAYDAVSQLADAGIVDGYLDGAFKGDQGMSRYEMAQIVAKAMTKSDKADAANKAMIDKLAAEFGDELANLGVRVDALEKKVDNVTWTGLIRYDWNTTNYETGKNGLEAGHRGTETNNIKLRLEPTFAINENWTGHARIDANVDKDDAAAGTDFSLEKVWVDGQYGKATVSLGRFDIFGNSSHGLTIDDKLTGAMVKYAPTADWTLKVEGGRTDSSSLFGKTSKKDVAGAPVERDSNATYYAAEVDYANGKWDAGVGYRHFGFTNSNGNAFFDNDKNSFSVVDLGAGYKFDKNVKLTADYAFGPSLNDVAGREDVAKNAWQVKVAYKGANAADKGSWGAYVAYRSLAPFAALYNTEDFKKGADGFMTLKGWELGADYTFAKNIIATAKFFSGKDTAYTDNNNVKGVFTRVDFKF